MLIGQYLKKAEEMQNEIIDLPDNVDVSKETAGVGSIIRSRT